jgi:hypothetical protein
MAYDVFRVNTHNRFMVVKITKLNHEQNLSRSEIAATLRLSIQKVQRLIRVEQDGGVMRIIIEPIMGIFGSSNNRKGQGRRSFFQEAAIAHLPAKPAPPTIASIRGPRCVIATGDGAVSVRRDRIGTGVMMGASEALCLLGLREGNRLA